MTEEGMKELMYQESLKQNVRQAQKLKELELAVYQSNEKTHIAEVAREHYQKLLSEERANSAALKSAFNDLCDVKDAAEARVERYEGYHKVLTADCNRYTTALNTAQRRIMELEAQLAFEQSNTKATEAALNHTVKTYKIKKPVGTLQRLDTLEAQIENIHEYPDLALVVENTSTKLRIGESTLINRLLRKHLVEFAYEIITNGAPVDEPV